MINTLAELKSAIKEAYKNETNINVNELGQTIYSALHNNIGCFFGAIMSRRDAKALDNMDFLNSPEIYNIIDIPQSREIISKYINLDNFDPWLLQKVQNAHDGALSLEDAFIRLDAIEG